MTNPITNHQSAITNDQAPVFPAFFFNCSPV
jgi:hypothetical protein